MSTTSLCRRQNVGLPKFTGVFGAFYQDAVPQKKRGGRRREPRWKLGTELFGLLALFWVWPPRPEDSVQIGFWQDHDCGHSEGSWAAELGPEAATLTATIR